MNSRLRLHPEWPVYVVAAVAWVAFAALVWRNPAGRFPGLPAVHVHMPAPLDASATVTSAGISAASVAFGLAVWMLMVAAMMFPSAADAFAYVAVSSARRRRFRVAFTFLAGFTAAWLPLGVVAALVHATLPRVAGLAAVGLVALAALWELTAAKRRAVLRCRRTSPIRFGGWGAYASSARYGWRNGLACVVSCGPWMLVLVILGHPLLLTVAVAAALYLEKRYRTGTALAPYIAAGGLVAAAFVA